MAAALDALCDWAEDDVRPRAHHLRVFDDNEQAVALLRAARLRAEERIPLADREATARGRRCRGGRAVDGLPPHGPRRPASTRRDPDRRPVDLGAGGELRPRRGPHRLERPQQPLPRPVRAAFAEYVGAEHALATSSCTGALHLALLALGIGPGDEVIVPELTWVATANAVAYTGATPVFADVEPDSWCLDPGVGRGAITARTKAVMPVHLYGHPARMDASRDSRGRTACASSRTPRPRSAPRCAAAASARSATPPRFSFQGAKLLVAGEGGMLVTNDDEVYERARASGTTATSRRSFWITRDRAASTGCRTSRRRSGSASSSASTS